MQNIIHIPKPAYPWPTVYSPISETFYKEENTWYDTDYGFMSPESIKRYKKQRLVQVGAFMSPTTSDRDIFRPIGRFAVYVTTFDDYVELMPLEELKVFRDRIFEVMTGEDPQPEEKGILRQMAAARKEFMDNGMPQFWIDRIATNFHRFITYGIMEETPFKFNKTDPSLARYLMIRAYSIGMVTYGDLIEPATGFALPVDIYNHPVIQRLVMLLATIIAIQNDYASIRKEMTIESERFNIIFILQNEQNVSFEEACIEGLRIHDEFVKEMESLSICLPDFSPYQKEVENYVYHMKLMVTGCNAWYYEGGTQRYFPDGFAVTPDGQNPILLDFEVKHISRE
ncbi:terpene synthase family protein [Chryseobacterium lathyri]|uniref:Terpene synthase n=1 Tax=Chryseobacterium lathyri TaxID=395933 RepID=A0ABT9SMB0_9FLAO|nr:hypothetical protein [Chryseobacterium lathyri]MDP9960576.1 hypothetical protein [Chryseobacterium lathyri]MDQ0067178.1 hypothetical protein [Chryseobacterium lathyri]